VLPKRASIGPVVAAPLLSACGSSGTGSSSATSPSLSAAASATSRVLIVVSDHDPGDPRSATLRLLRPDGTVVQTLTVKAGAELLGAAGSRIFVRSGTALKAIHQDGSVEELGELGGSGRFAASPDGKRWMWATRDANHGQVHLAGDGKSPRVVAQSSGTEPRAIEPYTWTPVGAFLMDAPVGIGGYILFRSRGGAGEKARPHQLRLRAERPLADPFRA
jgi:hypothetical protein